MRRRLCPSRLIHADRTSWPRGIARATHHRRKSRRSGGSGSARTHSGANGPRQAACPEPVAAPLGPPHPPVTPGNVDLEPTRSTIQRGEETQWLPRRCPQWPMEVDSLSARCTGVHARPRRSGCASRGPSVERRVRLPDGEPIDPEQDDSLKRCPNEQINRTLGVTTDRDMADRSVNVGREEQYECSGSNPSGESPGPWHEETDGHCQFQDPRQVHEKHPPRDPGRQHLREYSGRHVRFADAPAQRPATPDENILARSHHSGGMAQNWRATRRVVAVSDPMWYTTASPGLRSWIESSAP
jgi:hypothetical protein